MSKIYLKILFVKKVSGRAELFECGLCSPNTCVRVRPRHHTRATGDACDAKLVLPMALPICPALYAPYTSPAAILLAEVDANRRHVARSVADAVVWAGASAMGAPLGHARRFDRPFIEASRVFQAVAPESKAATAIVVGSTTLGGKSVRFEVPIQDHECLVSTSSLPGIMFTGAGVLVCTEFGVLLGRDKRGLWQDFGGASPRLCVWYGYCARRKRSSNGWANSGAFVRNT